MGSVGPESPAALVCAILYKEDSFRDQALEGLKEDFGPVARVQSPFPFDFTSYYHKEMGAPLFKQIAVFEELAPQGFLAEIKHLTNRREENLSRFGARTVNLDPGLLLPSRLVLASTKDRAHRIYLSGGIYGEVTLLYHEDAFTPLPWTYADYRLPSTLTFLREVREWYLGRTKRLKEAEG
ncbi:MAG: DUF4416 family protein [Acidobacteriota bacterium]